jgi:hypothetical protein
VLNSRLHCCQKRIWAFQNLAIEYADGLAKLGVGLEAVAVTLERSPRVEVAKNGQVIARLLCRQVSLFFNPIAAENVSEGFRSWIAGVDNYHKNGLVKPPRRDTRALSPAYMFGGMAPLRLAAQKNRPHAPLALMRSAPAYFLCKWGIDKTKRLNMPINWRSLEESLCRYRVYSIQTKAL